MSTIEFDHVTKRYGTIAAVNRVSFTVNHGEIVSLLGPSGCGKTTTLRLIGGFEAPDEGTIRIAGRTVRDERPYERNIGLVFQDYALFPHMTVTDNVAYGLRRRHMRPAAIASRVQEMLSLVQLSQHGGHRPHQLSGGQQQRVALARALATSPELVLLDEPLSALDAKLRHALRLDLRRILSAVGATAIVVTHDQEEAMSMGDRIMVMNEGEIVQEGPSHELYERPRTRFVAEFLGRSNWLSGALDGSVSEGLRSFTTRSGDKLLVAAGDFDPAPAQNVALCVRPERLRLGRYRKAASLNRLQGTVTDVAYLGSDIHTSLVTRSGIHLLAIEKNRGGRPEPPGSDIDVVFEPQDCILLRD